MRDVLDRLGIGEVANRHIRELSGGQQQRVGIARSLAVEPDIWFLDEPFSALDPLIRREMQDELLSLQAKLQKTMVFITHDFLEAIKMGDNIAIMKDGEISQIGTPEEIVANPVNKYVSDFTEDVPRYKVLSAGKIMRTASARAKGDPVKVSAKIEKLIDRVAESDTPVPVADAEGKIVGEIDRTMIIRAMQSRT